MDLLNYKKMWTMSTTNMGSLIINMQLCIFMIKDPTFVSGPPRASLRVCLRFILSLVVDGRLHCCSTDENKNVLILKIRMNYKSDRIVNIIIYYQLMIMKRELLLQSTRMMAS